MNNSINNQGRKYFNTKMVAEKTLIPAKTWELWRRTGYGPPYIRVGKRVLYEDSVTFSP